MRVDIVITWVDGSDINWRQKRENFKKESLIDTLKTSNVEGRYRDNGDLKYLLRSIDKYWDLEGEIFIVTDRQIPKFLKKDSRIKIIDHSDFIDTSLLPTFSSRAIEASLHKIDGIAEHFVSFNDDMMLTRKVCFEDFFGIKGHRVYLTNEELPSLNSSDILSGHNDSLNAKKWMLNNYKKSLINFIPCHYPKGIKKSLMSALESQHPDIFLETRKEKFRKNYGQSILANLYPDWCLTLGYGDYVEGQCNYLYTDDIEKNFVTSIRNSINKDLVVCINDTTDNRTDLEVLMNKFDSIRNEIFPKESRFEIKNIPIIKKKY